MQFDQTLSDEQFPNDPQHDPNGEAIQCHELPDGELLLTFSPEWAAENDYAVGDVITFCIDEESGKLTLTNTTADERRSAERV
jgi:hypothetical protein